MIDTKIFVQKMLKQANHHIDDDWRDFLFEYGMWTKFNELYDEYDVKKSNIIISFICLAFSPHSNMVHLHMDRSDNKRDILEQLGGNYLSESDQHLLLYNQRQMDGVFVPEEEDELDNIMTEADAKVKDEFLTKYLTAVSLYIIWHRCSKFKNWMNAKEFISTNTTYATTPPSSTQQVASKLGVVTIKTPDNVIAFTAIKKADLIVKCMVMEDRASKIDDFLKKKYADLDALVMQEMDATGFDAENFNVMRIEDRLKRDLNKKQ